MTEANRRPSNETRRLLARAWTQAGQCRVNVHRFAIATRQAMLAFDIDANAWGMSDTEYDEFEVRAGLRRVLDAADRMTETLGKLNDDRAA